MAIKLETLRDLTETGEYIDYHKCGIALYRIEQELPLILTMTDLEFKKARLDVFIDSLIADTGLNKRIIEILIGNHTQIEKILNVQD